MRKTVYSPESQVLAKILADARRESGLYQAELADRLGSNQTIISNIERGHRKIDLIEFYDFANAIGCDAVQLYARVVDAWKSM